MDNKKQFWVLISFMVPSIEPRAGYICVNADTPEEVEQIIRSNMEPEIMDLVIESISEEVPDEVRAQVELNKPTTVN